MLSSRATNAATTGQSPHSSRQRFARISVLVEARPGCAPLVPQQSPGLASTAPLPRGAQDERVERIVQRPVPEPRRPCPATRPARRTRAGVNTP